MMWHCEKLLFKHFSFPCQSLIHAHQYPWLAQLALYDIFNPQLGLCLLLGFWTHSKKILVPFVSLISNYMQHNVQILFSLIVSSHGVPYITILSLCTHFKLCLC